MEIGVWVKVPKFKDYRPRKDIRHPSWLKLSNRIMEDEDFYAFTHEEICVFIYILCLCSQRDADTVLLNFEAAERKCRLKKDVVLSALTKLESGRLCVRVPAASRTRHDRVAALGIEGEEREETSAPTPSSQPVFKNAKELRDAVDIITWHGWLKEYRDATWLEAEITKAFTFHSADPVKIPRTRGAWIKKLHTWFSIGNEKRSKSPPESTGQISGLADV